MQNKIYNSFLSLCLSYDPNGLCELLLKTSRENKIQFKFGEEHLHKKKIVSLFNGSLQHWLRVFCHFECMFQWLNRCWQWNHMKWRFYANKTLISKNQSRQPSVSFRIYICWCFCFRKGWDWINRSESTDVMNQK